jgi:hypothetical protein
MVRDLLNLGLQNLRSLVETRILLEVNKLQKTYRKRIK